MTTKLRATLVEPPGQSGYLPIAAASLAAATQLDSRLADEVDVRLMLDTSSAGFGAVMSRIMADGPPDVLGLSCQGWAIPRNDQIAKAVREQSPGTLIVYGGNHVSHGGDDFFGRRPYADVLVNGEGELTFTEMLAVRLGSTTPDFGSVPGLSWKASPGQIITTADRERVSDLDYLPSPYLTGRLTPHLDQCRTALIETNRGCPYKCSFCYWGQATGARVHKYSVGRVREDMEFLAKRGIDSWYICDANFGMQQRDQEIVDLLISLRKRYGAPRVVHTNWAKNSNERIVDICARLNAAGVYCTFTLALQTTTEEALQLANRRNMKINKLREVGEICRKRNIVPRGDLIWGLPGESYTDFLAGFDELSEYTSLVGTYPHYLLPNTEYSLRREELGLKSEKVEANSDYEYCVEHPQMSRADFDRGLRFISSNNILSLGSSFFRVYPRVARLIAGLTPAQTIGSFGDWIRGSRHPAAAKFVRCFDDPIRHVGTSFMETWRLIRGDRDTFVDLMAAYVEESFHRTQSSTEVADALREAFRYDAVTFAKVFPGEPDQLVTAIEDFEYDFHGFARSDPPQLTRGRTSYQISWPCGLRDYPLDKWYYGLPQFLARVEPVQEASPDPAFAPTIRMEE